MKISLLYNKKKIQWIVKKKFGRRSSFPFLSKYFARKPYPEIHFTFPRRSSFVKSVNSAKQILGLFKYVHIVHMCRHRAQSRWCYLRLLWVYFLLFYRRKIISCTPQKWFPNTMVMFLIAFVLMTCRWSRITVEFRYCSKIIR